jgi:hypothetical protein
MQPRRCCYAIKPRTSAVHAISMCSVRQDLSFESATRALQHLMTSILRHNMTSNVLALRSSMASVSASFLISSHLPPQGLGQLQALLQAQVARPSSSVPAAEQAFDVTAGHVVGHELAAPVQHDSMNPTWLWPAVHLSMGTSMSRDPLHMPPTAEAPSPTNSQQVMPALHWHVTCTHTLLRPHSAALTKPPYRSLAAAHCPPTPSPHRRT